MDRLKFRNLFLMFAIIFFVGSRGNIYSSIMLILASVYTLVEIIPELLRRWR